MECEIDDNLPFLDVLISKGDDGSFSHQVFRKLTPNNIFMRIPIISLLKI